MSRCAYALIWHDCERTAGAFLERTERAKTAGAAHLFANLRLDFAYLLSTWVEVTVPCVCELGRRREDEPGQFKRA